MNRARDRSRRVDGALFGLAAVLAALVAGFAASRGSEGVYLLGGVIFLGALAVGIHNWRWSLYGLLLYVPVSGLPIIIAYPDTAAPNLFKDFLFVIPTYVGFATWANARRKSFNFPGAPVIPLGLLTLMVVAQAFNPSLPNMLVGAIGMKVWLLYIPLYFIAYHYVESKRDLFGLLKVMSLGALLPAVVGILEALLIYGGKVNTVYGFYGDAAAAVSQNFAQLDYEGAALRRVPSLFSFVAQYYSFIAAMVAVSYAWWRGWLAGTRRSWVGAAVWATMIAAAFLSGARAAFLFIPLLAIMLMVFERGIARLALSRIVAPIVLFLAASSVVGASFGTVVGNTLDTAGGEFSYVFVQGFTEAFDLTWAGLGTGIDTTASRYAYAQQDLFQAVNGTWYESWYVKVMLELGIAGLVIVALLFGTILRRGFGDLGRLRDPQLRAVAAGILAYLMWAVLSSVKGQYLDFDPANVYFWLLAGVLAKLIVLDRRTEEQAAEASPSALKAGL